MTTATFTATPTAPSIDLSRKAVWTGGVLSTLAVLFLLFDATGKLMQPEQVVKGTTELGWPVSALVPLGVIQLLCLAFYLIPRTSLFGAILWTGYLGGAIATHLRLDQPLFSHTLFPTYIAALLWVGLWLRDRRLRALLPISR
ncbi:MAG TPA: DoxX family protein [Thermoanaerobaculia bacterium]|jgi:hypothetical protein